ncbi:MAG: hypothetical protein V8S37_02235 [Lachnospiraceae bacterium]
MTHYIAVLTIKDRKREEYIGALKHARLVEQFREQHGNVHYFISESVDDPDVVIVSDLGRQRQILMRIAVLRS